MKTIHVDDIINQNKLSRLQKQVLILSFLIFFCDGLDTGIIGFIAPALLDDWGISKPKTCSSFKCRFGWDVYWCNNFRTDIRPIWS